MFQSVKGSKTLVRRPVVIELRDGRKLTGELMLGPKVTAAQLLGRTSPFLTIRTAKGDLALNRNMIAALLLGDDAENEEKAAPRKPERPEFSNAWNEDAEEADDEAAPVDPCRVLQVRPGASRDELKAAWRRRMRQCHPDRVRGRGHSEDVILAAQREAQRVNSAYETLVSMRQPA